MSCPMPRLFVVRHGETEWTLNGRHTGKSDIPLTLRGEEQIKSKAKDIVGEGLIIDPNNLSIAFVSPRQRAHKTFNLLTEHLPEQPKYILTEDVREWDYGEYEGLKPREIKEINPSWTVWKNGCPGGESVDEMTRRVDAVIAKVREYHRQYVEEQIPTRDVLITSHGHFSRCLITRWINAPLHFGTSLTVEPGSITILGYDAQIASLDVPSLVALNLYA